MNNNMELKYNEEIMQTTTAKQDITKVGNYSFDNVFDNQISEKNKKVITPEFKDLLKAESKFISKELLIEGLKNLDLVLTSYLKYYNLKKEINKNDPYLIPTCASLALVENNFTYDNGLNVMKGFGKKKLDCDTCSLFIASLMSNENEDVELIDIYYNNKNTTHTGILINNNGKYEPFEATEIFNEYMGKRMKKMIKDYNKGKKRELINHSADNPIIVSRNNLKNYKIQPITEMLKMRKYLFSNPIKLILSQTKLIVYNKKRKKELEKEGKEISF